MNLAELQRRVDRHVKLDLTSYYDAYCAAGGGDIDGFLAFLGAARAIDASVLKELHGMAEVETPSVLDPAYQGTRLAAWARTATLLGTGGPGQAGRGRWPAAWRASPTPAPPTSTSCRSPASARAPWARSTSRGTSTCGARSR